MATINIYDRYSYEICDNLQATEALAQSVRTTDPLREDIAPSLLNKHDIIKYVSKTGMIFPFNFSDLKSASYEVRVGRHAIFWDESGEKIELSGLYPKDKIPLKKNSITYVDVDANFFLPFYIAVRFNLAITHVHRGLLLGTGPLVDPGFCGKIMIPIHNLTNNDYAITPGEPLIAVEFTKLTIDKEIIEDWYADKIKKKSNFTEFFKSALPLGVGKVESSLAGTLAEARDQIASFKEYKNIAIGTAVAIFVAVTTLIIASIGIVSDANKNVSDAAAIIKKSEKTDYALKDFATEGELESIQRQVDSLQQTIAKYGYISHLELGQREQNLEARLSQLEEEINKLSATISATKNKEVDNKALKKKEKPE